MEKIVWRPIELSEEVHHIDHNKLNNAPENLKLYDSHYQHWMENHYQDVQDARDQYFLVRGRPD